MLLSRATLFSPFLGVCSLLKESTKGDHETQVHIFSRAVCEREMSKDVQLWKKKKKRFVIHQLKILKIPHHRGVPVGIAMDVVQRRDAKGEGKSEGKSLGLNESIVNCAVNCVVCTSL